MQKKKRSFLFSPLFLAYHVLLAIGLIVVLLSGHMHITTDFVSLLPSTGLSEGVAKAEKVFASSQNGNVNLLLAHEDFSVVRDSAIRLHKELSESGVFSEISLEGVSPDFDEISSFLSTWRYNLIPEETGKIISEVPELFQQQSLSTIFGPMTFSSLDDLDRDPFLIDESIYRDILQKISSSSPVMPKDGVLAKEYDGRWYVLLQGTLTSESLNITRTDGGIARIYEIGDALSASVDGLSISYSGFPFHSFESASNAQREIALITGVSIAAILLMFIILLRNIHVVGFFLTSTFFSLFSAFAAISICFKDIHILTMIFGTSLIGTSIDYAIHYYLAYAGRNNGDNGYAVAAGLVKNLSVSFISTAICYLFILFSPYEILRQVAVFSFAGLLSSFLTVMGLFPVISKPRMVSANALAWKLKPMKEHRTFIIPLMVIVLLIVSITSGNMMIRNSITDLYEMSDRLLESEMTAGQVLGFSSSSYVIIEGDDEFDAREKEAAFSSYLAPLIASGSIESYLAPSIFIPTPTQQRNSLALRDNLVRLAEDQASILGLNIDIAMDALTSEERILGFEQLPSVFMNTVSPLLPGEIDGHYYIALLVFGETGDDAVRKLADEHSYATYFCKAKDVDRQLDQLTEIILKIFLIAFIAIMVLLVVVFGKKGLYMASAPVITVCSVLIAVTAAGYKFDFFFAVGLVIVIGLGLDYMVFAGNSRKKPMLAITLSYLTTALSFGTLIFSSFRPVHIFGFTVFAGITAAFIAALASGQKEN